MRAAAKRVGITLLFLLIAYAGFAYRQRAPSHRVTIIGMGLFRKMTSVSTFGAVDFRSDKERTARYTKQTRNAARAQRRIMKRQAKAAQPDLRYTVPPNIPMRSQLPPAPAGAPPAQWNGTVWQVWDEHQRRWLVWDGHTWR